MLLLDINTINVDEHHELLDGVSFSLVNAADEVMAEEQSQDGRLIFSELTSVPYTIIETEIPEGYTTSEAGNEVEVELVNEHVDITVVNERIKGSLEILKTDIVDDRSEERRVGKDGAREGSRGARGERGGQMRAA